MQFHKHPELNGRHAFLSASKYSWIRYDDEKLALTFKTAMAAALGTRKHALAAELISLGQKLPKTQQTLAMYVNDAIGFRMTPELLVAYSPNAFGTVDALSFRRERGFDKTVLRISDLKTGVSKASPDQLMIYAALFCLEYDLKPHALEIIMRIYQNDYIQQWEPDPDDIVHIMDKIVQFDKLINALREEAA